MKIQLLKFEKGAKIATGYTVIIDVLRAFSVACYLFDKDIASLYVVKDVQQAFLLKEKNPGLVLVGERDEKKVKGFDYGNSPTEILNAGFSGKNVILTTTAGTLGLTSSINSDILVTGSFLNAGAIVQHIREVNPESVSLVAMGYRAEFPADEDVLCAEYIKNELSGIPSDFKTMVEVVRTGTGKRFFKPENIGHSPPKDFDLCMSLNKFSFILEAKQKHTYVQLQKKNIY